VLVADVLNGTLGKVVKPTTNFITTNGRCSGVESGKVASCPLPMHLQDDTRVDFILSLLKLINYGILDQKRNSVSY
jgi:hypothetical protein